MLPTLFGLFLAGAAVFVAVARLRPAWLGPRWLRAVIWVALVIAGLALVDQLWGTALAYILYLTACLAISFLVDDALPPRG